MAQPSVSNISVNGMNPTDTKDQSEENCDRKQEGPQHNQPNVRHIPIFVEGRDKPLLNTNVERSPSGSQRQSSPTFNDLSRTGSIYDRAKDIPVRKPMQQNAGRTESPSRTIPINVLHKAPRDLQGAPAAGFHPHHQRAPQFEIPQIQKSASKVHSIPIKVEHASSQTGAPQPQKRHPSAMQQNVTDEVDAKSQPNSSVQQSLDAITKIQKIQHDVLDLMNRVEQFRGGSRTDKEYLYLDEMLTQNLLKLDTIDAEGKDNIKAARKEAINCINKCIAVLEAKIDSGTTASSKSDNQNGTEGHNQQKDQRIQQNQGQEQQTRNQPGQQQVSNS